MDREPAAGSEAQQGTTCLGLQTGRGDVQGAGGLGERGGAGGGVGGVPLSLFVFFCLMMFPFHRNHRLRADRALECPPVHLPCKQGCPPNTLTGGHPAPACSVSVGHIDWSHS